MVNSFKSTLPGKHFICPSILNNTFPKQSNLGCRSLPFMTSDTFFQPLLACKVSFEKSADSHMETPLQVTICSSLAAFKILSSSLTFGILIMMCLGVVFFGSNYLELSVLLGLVCLFPSPNQGCFLSLFFLIRFPFLALLFSFWHSYDLDVGMFGDVPKAPQSILIF